MPGTDLDPVALTAALVAIDSVNPDLVAGGAGEHEIAAFCERWFEEHGFEVYRLESLAGRPSVVGIARGVGGGRTLMLNGHIDTVSIASFEGNPLAPRIVDGRMYGRGAFDMKSGVAAMMVAAAWAKDGLRGDVVVCCVADEEHGSRGTEEVLAGFTADAGIVTEPMMLQPALWHKGFAWFEVTIHGRAYHGSRPDMGIDAIAKAGHFLVALEQLAARLADSAGHPRLGPGSIHASIIEGGEEASSYPARCTITVERRTVPGETGDVVETELRSVLDGLVVSVPDFRYDLRRTLVREPFEADPGSEIVRSLLRHTTQVSGEEPLLRAEPFWTDAALMANAGIPTVLFGASGQGAHAADEWVDIASVEIMTDVLTGVIRDFCG